MESSSSILPAQTACGACSRSRRTCLVSSSSSSKRCSECVRQGRSHCDAVVPTMPSIAEWESIEKQKRKLEAEEEEAMAKILRLRAQKKLLVDREERMIDRGLRALDREESSQEETPAPDPALTEDLLIPPSGDPFWDLFSSETVVGESSHSVSCFLVPMCRLFRRTPSI